MNRRLTLKLEPIKILLYCIVILNLNVFYLVDSDSIPLSDICLLIEVVFFTYVFLKYKGKTKYTYGILIVFSIILAITSAIAAFYNYSGQPFFWGFRAQRAWLGALMMYFPITKLLKHGRIAKEDIFGIIDNIGIIYGLIILLQLVVGDSNVFMYAGNNTRYGTLRLYISTTYLTLLFFYHLYRVLRGEKIQKKDVFMILLPIIVVIYATKTRMRIVAFLTATMLLIFFQKLTKRKIMICVIAVVVFCAFMGTDAGQDIWGIVSGTEVSVKDTSDTSEIRDIGRAMYIKANTENWGKFLFGSGYANDDWPAAVRASGLSKGIGMNDNGLFGLFFYYGFSFIIWGIILSYKLIRQGIKSGNSYLAFYLIYGLLGSYTLFPGFYVTDISFAIICAIVDTEKERIDNEHINFCGKLV